MLKLAIGRVLMMICCGARLMDDCIPCLEIDSCDDMTWIPTGCQLCV